MIIDELENNLNDKENLNNQNRDNISINNILQGTGQNQSMLVDYVMKSGYKVFKGKQSSSKQYKDFSGIPDYMKNDIQMEELDQKP